MDIMKRKTKQREKVRKEKTFTISLEFLQLGVGWSYSHLTENKTKQNKTKQNWFREKNGFKTEFLYLQDPAYFVPPCCLPRHFGTP